MRTALQHYAHWLADYRAPWSEAAQRIAHDTLRDAIGCLVAGAQEPVTRKVAAGLPCPPGAIGCTVAGRIDGLPAPWAALVNGTAAHALDFDDNHTPAMAHASAVLLPALLAAGESRAHRGDALVDAFLCGLALMTGLGFGLNPVHRQRGWHATSTIGTLGAAGAVARLWRLDEAATLHALGIACSLCGGSMQQFGTDTKPLHAGLAAQGGLQAALWAEAGVSAAADALDGPHGLQRLLVGPDLDDLRARGTGLEVHGFDLRFSPLPSPASALVEAWPPVLKRWPNCASAHPAMQLAMALRQTVVPRTDDRLVVRTRPAYLANLRYAAPQDAAQARFSLHHGVALAWWQGEASLADFDTPCVTSECWAGWRAQVTAEPLAPLAVPEIEAELEVLRADGVSHRTVLRDGELEGDSQRPIPEAELRAKFRACVRRLLDDEAADTIEQWLARPALHTVAALASALRKTDEAATGSASCHST